jgi:hypothetical protein
MHLKTSILTRLIKLTEFIIAPATDEFNSCNITDIAIQFNQHDWSNAN